MIVDSSKNVDMIHGPLLKKMVMFALPLAAGSVLQQLFNMCDSAIVGNFASSEALAAVGANTSVVSLFVNFFVGISVGTSAVIANYFGSGREKDITKAVHTSITLALICGLFLAIFVQFIAQPMLLLMGTPKNVIDLAVLYLRIYALGMPFILLYNFGSAVLRSSGDSRTPFIALVIGGVVNAILNMILVIIFHLSVEGVAIATAVSNILASGIVLNTLMHREEVIRFDYHRLAIHNEELFKVLRIGVPAGLQAVVFSLSNVVIQSSINSFGSSVVAGSSAAANFEFISYCIVNGFSQTATTFIGQNYGAKEYGRCRKIWKIALACGIGATMVVDLTIVLFRYPLVHLFTQDTAVIPYAAQRVLQVMSLHWLLGTYEITGSTLRGYGNSMVPALLSVFGTCVVRLVWVYFTNMYYHTFTVLLLVYPISWTITGILVIGYYLMARKKLELA